MEWLAAIVLGCAGTAGGMWAWARAEARLFDDPVDRGTPLPPPQAERQTPRQDGGWLPPGEEGHLAAAVAFRDAMGMYVEECERRADVAAAARPAPGLPRVIDVQARP